jgi:hypothetical protein
MGNYFSSSKSESIQIINETDHVHVIVTNSKDHEGVIEKKDEHVIKIEETTMLNEVNEEIMSTSNFDDNPSNDIDEQLKPMNSCLIQKKNLKRKNKKKNKKKQHLQ